MTAIIAVYNGAALIRRAIDSVLAQTRAVDETIVVDDGSTDSTRDVVSSYGDRVRYIYQPNGGVAAARNTGVRSATTEWVAFLDHDDEWLPHKIERQLQLLTANPQAAMCYSAFWCHGLHGTQRLEHLPKETLHPTIRFRNPFPPSVALFRRSQVLAIGGFDDHLKGAEDWDFHARFLAVNQAIDSPEPLVNYYEVQTSASRNYRAMLSYSLSIIDKTLLLGQSGMSRYLWRRRVKSALYYRAAISARESRDPAGKFLLQSFAHWPLPGLTPERFKTLLAQLRDITSTNVVNVFVLAYLRRFPLERGKWRLLKAAARFLVADIGKDVFARVHGPELKSLVFGSGEQKEIERFLSLVCSGMVVFDVGANIGIYSLLSARSVGSAGCIHAFEPTPFVANRLRDNVRLNKFQNIIVNQVALSDQVGATEFYVHEEDDRSSLGAVSTKTITVQTITLDEYVQRARIPHIDLMKIDVEGAEVKVLRGAQALLSRRDAPAMMLEFNPSALALMGTSDNELAALLSGYGYKLEVIAQHDGYQNVIAIK